MDAARQEQLVLAGDVADFDVGSLMMVFGLGRQLITLEVDDGAGNAQGNMVIKGGRIVSAVAGELTGPNAVRKLLMVGHPSKFRVLRNPNVVGPTLTSIGAVADFTEFSELVEPSAPDEPVPVLHGELKDFALADVLRALSVARQYMVLRVIDELGENAGQIKLKGGQVLGVEAGALVDLAALQELLAAPSSYRFAVHHERGPQPHARALGAVSELLPMAAAIESREHADQRVSPDQTAAAAAEAPDRREQRPRARDGRQLRQVRHHEAAASGERGTPVRGGRDLRRPRRAGGHDRESKPACSWPRAWARARASTPRAACSARLRTFSSRSIGAGNSPRR